MGLIISLLCEPLTVKRFFKELSDIKTEFLTRLQELGALTRDQSVHSNDLKTNFLQAYKD